MKIHFTLNHQPITLQADPARNLLDVLRDELGLTGTKQGCDHEGECGACTVLLDGQPVRACLTPLGKVAGRRVLTVERLGSPERLHPLQQAFIEAGAVQCGYCTPGMPLAALALQKLLFLAERGLPTTYTPVVLRGNSGPVTAAGAIALANAGELAGLVLAQLKREGTPVILTGGVNDMLDMRTMDDVYAAPENRVMLVELAHYYGLPIFGLAGASDSKLPDEQAAAEAAFSLILETLVGAHTIHDVGYLEEGTGE